MWITSMGNHGAAGVSQNASILVVLVMYHLVVMDVSNDATNEHTAAPYLHKTVLLSVKIEA